MFGPANLPIAIRNEFNRRANDAGRTDQVKQRLAALGVDPVNASSEQLGHFVASEMTKWAEVARISGARVD
jgi:tripartite-type tricarboxylate transporter receptor subunit TctC